MLKVLFETTGANKEPIPFVDSLLADSYLLNTTHAKAPKEPHSMQNKSVFIILPV